MKSPNPSRKESCSLPSDQRHRGVVDDMEHRDLRDQSLAYFFFIILDVVHIRFLLHFMRLGSLQFPTHSWCLKNIRSVLSLIPVI